MIDQFGRNIHYLRLSVTERCNLRCTYCRADEGICPKAEELSAEQFAQIVKAFAILGVDKVRLTGGEPLLRRDILEIITRVKSTTGIADLSMTTNAHRLVGQAAILKKAGLDRVNISLDSLNAEVFRQMTGGSLAQVLAGIDEAIAAGLTPVKINVVLVRNQNNAEIDDFIALTRTKPVDVRFIELMPLGELGREDANRLSNAEIISARPYLQPLAPRYPGQPSVDYAIAGHLGRVGFISPYSKKFCADCNRIRVMSDGKVRSCLGFDREVSLLEPLHQGEAALLETLKAAMFNKPLAHEFEQSHSHGKNMRRIGG